jgi:hypothetical protein
MAAALVAAGSAAQAQEVPPPRVAPAQAVPAQAAPPGAADRRDDIKMLEAVFTTAVKNGADKLALQMQSSDPGSLFVTGPGRTRGFDLQGYGVFFDVDVPMMRQSVLWSTRQLTQQDTRAQLENYVATLPPGPARDLAARELRRMQQMGQRQGAAPTPVTSPAGGGTVVAANVDAPTPAATPPPATETRDPNELYTEAVKTSLIDAMLKYSVGLRIGPEEWLTVAARDSEGPLGPGQVDDASTIVIRIKGGDLAAFQANKLTREDVLKKVEVKKF